MLERDIKNAFGKADDETKNLVHNTLVRLNMGENIRQPQGFRLKTAVIVIAACLIISTAAFAAFQKFGIQDFTGGRIDSGIVLPDASDIVQTGIGIETGQAGFATFAVREAIFSGSDICFTVAVTPLDKNILLVPYYSPDVPIQHFIPTYQGQATVGDYALAIGKTPIVAGFIWDYVDRSTSDCRIEDDGTLLFLIGSKYIGKPTETLEIALSFTFSTPEQSDSTQITETLSFALTRTGRFEERQSLDTAEFTDAGVRVDKVVLTAGEMSVNVSIEYTVINAEKFAATNSGLWFELLTDDGERYSEIGSSTVRPLDNEAREARFVHYCSISALESLPNHITIRGYNFMSKEAYEAHTMGIN